MPPAAGVPAAQASDAARSSAFLAQCHTFPLRLRYPQPAFSNSMTLRCQPKKRAVFSRWEKIPSHETRDRKSTRLNSSHGYISYAVFCLKKKNSDLVLHQSAVI